MERKYYLRGLGLGIVMTAVIMGIALSGSHKMSDAEVIQRAKELGMVEDTHLMDVSAGEEQQQTKQNIEDDLSKSEKNPETEPESPQVGKTDISGEADVSGEEAAAGESQTSERENPAEPAGQELSVAEPVGTESVSVETESKPAVSEHETAETKENTNEMTRQEEKPSPSAREQSVTIVGGDGSYTVALKLKEAGVVTSAETFDDFLCERGYDKKLRTGTFRIPANASDEQIARIVTGQE